MYPVSDMLARIRNGSLVGAKSVLVRHSKLNLSILKALKSDGYVLDYEYPITKSSSQADKYCIKVWLKYDSKGVPVLRYAYTVSKPSRRVYTGSGSFRTREQYSTLIVSTNKGVMSHLDARKLNLGGEVICEVGC